MIQDAVTMVVIILFALVGVGAIYLIIGAITEAYPKKGKQP